MGCRVQVRTYFEFPYVATDLISGFGNKACRPIILGFENDVLRRAATGCGVDYQLSND